MMNKNWIDANQRYLMAELDSVREALKRYAENPQNTGEKGRSSKEKKGNSSQHKGGIKKCPEETANTLTPPPSLDLLCATFGLSPFERDILLMCAGIELDTAFKHLCASAQGDPACLYPTFSLALAALPGAYWSAITPFAPLRYWLFIELGPGSELTKRQLRIDEYILHFLAGISYMDERLCGILRPADATPSVLLPSHKNLSGRIALAWSQKIGSPFTPLIQLCGDEPLSKQSIASAACAKLGMNLKMISIHSLPSVPSELDILIRLCSREALLTISALFIDCEELDRNDTARFYAFKQMIERIKGPVIVSSPERLRGLKQSCITLDVPKPTPKEQLAVWEGILGETANDLNGNLKALTYNFNMNIQAIHAAGNQILSSLESPDAGVQRNPQELADVLWDVCRQQTRPPIDNLAQRIEPIATWDELVLPSQQKQILKEIAVHVRQRAKVYDTWGFAAMSSRGLGISALFSGVSGTGKTMAAEVLANELRLDLYKIDLSQVVSKYIGETEKNLRRVFDAAEKGGAILFFDEADSLFGKRSEVKDSHDRYANIEVSYLLQRMESYRGLAILTTNMKNALDSAFLRRIRFIVQFPFPDTKMREEIWRRIFPKDTPQKGLNLQRLSRLNITGGNIRNIALNATFLAAEAKEPVKMSHLLRAVHSEYAKIEKNPSNAEIGGWV